MRDAPKRPISSGLRKKGGRDTDSDIQFDNWLAIQLERSPFKMHPNSRGIISSTIFVIESGADMQ